MFTLRADRLWYLILRERHLYSIPFPALQQWAFVRAGNHDKRCPGRIWEWPEKEQRKREQKNDTWGRTVPIKVIGEEVGFVPTFGPFEIPGGEDA
jgi:hypothetical protein